MNPAPVTQSRINRPERKHGLRHHSPRHGDKNFKQHKAFLDEACGTPRHKEVIDWFLTLPLWLELDAIRVVHACWHQPVIDYLAPQLASGNRLSAELMVEATREPADEAEKDTPDNTIFKALEAYGPLGTDIGKGGRNYAYVVGTRGWSSVLRTRCTFLTTD